MGEPTKRRHFWSGRGYFRGVRRIPVEWLLVPLFLLPIAACVAYATWAHSSYLADLHQIVVDARGLVRRSVEGSDGDFWRRYGFLSVPQASRFPSNSVLSLPHAGAEPVSWLIGDSYPSGARAADLARPKRRAQLEAGTPAVELSVPSGELRRFATSYNKPDVAALRRATLPAATLLFLFDRLPADTPFPEGRAAAREALRCMAALQMAGDPDAPGLHRMEGGLVFRDRSGGPIYTLRLIPDTVQLDLLRRDLDDRVTVVFGDRAAPGALWSGEMAAPVAGTWSVVARHGRAWWRVPRYRYWVGPGLIAGFVYLVALCALTYSIHRRNQLDEARARFLTEIAHAARTST
jgi:hypothetical protein